MEFESWGDYMAWKLDSDRPIYSQVVERLQTRIVAGECAPGSRLPSVRDLAMEAGINPNTMQRAFAELERQGLVTTQRTSGRLVTEDEALIQRVRAEMAAGKVREFLTQLEEMGFSRGEVVDLLGKVGGSDL